MSFLKFFKNGEKDIDAANIVQSMSKAKTLYKELVKLAHPDRNPQKRELAEEFTQLLNQARFDYRKLLILQKQIKEVRQTSFRLNQFNIPSGRIQVARAIYSFIFCSIFILTEKWKIYWGNHTLLQVTQYNALFL